LADFEGRKGDCWFTFLDFGVMKSGLVPGEKVKGVSKKGGDITGVKGRLSLEGGGGGVRSGNINSRKCWNRIKLGE